MSTFADDFRAEVIPSLQQRARFAGWMLAVGRWTFPEAEHHVLIAAMMRGAGRLPEQILEELEKWVGATIERYDAEFRPGVEAYRRQIAATVDDVAAWNRDLDDRFGWGASYREVAPIWATT